MDRTFDARGLRLPTDDVDDDRNGRSRSGWRVLVPSRKVTGTLAGILVTAWLLPALSHQWQDRQKARELQAALVTKIGRATTQALVTSQFLAAGRLPHKRIGGFNQNAFNQLDLDWQQERAEIEAQLQAYFPGSGMAGRWHVYSEFVRNTYFLVTDRQFLRDATVDHIDRITPASEQTLRAQLVLLRTPFVDSTRSKPRAAYYFASREVLGEKARLTRAILTSRPRGFSTGASDLVNDLLP